MNDNVFVSPDSDKLLIYDDSKINLISTKEQVTVELYLEWDLPKIGSYILSNKSIQWAPNSLRFGIITSNPINEDDYFLNVYDIY